MDVPTAAPTRPEPIWPTGGELDMPVWGPLTLNTANRMSRSRFLQPYPIDIPWRGCCILIPPPIRLFILKSPRDLRAAVPWISLTCKCAHRHPVCTTA